MILILHAGKADGQLLPFWAFKEGEDFLGQPRGIPHHLVSGPFASFVLGTHGLLYAATSPGTGCAKESPLSLPLASAIFFFFFATCHRPFSKCSLSTYLSPASPAGHSHCCGLGSCYLTRSCFLFALYRLFFTVAPGSLIWKSRSAPGPKDPQSFPTERRVKPKLLTWPLVSFLPYASNFSLQPQVLHLHPTPML